MADITNQFINYQVFSKSYTGLTADSRQVKTGYLFAALPGTHTDGSAYINEAIEHGAKKILAVPGTQVPDGIELISADNPRQRFAELAAEFYGKQPAHIVAVTGTNGKTSTVTFLQQLWELLGEKAGSLGTLGAHGTQFARAGSLTTPDPVLLHATLADLASAGIDHLALEASSHGLDQYRLSGVKMACGIFTNLTRDHLDYHGDMAAYGAAKARLFGEVLPSGAAAVLNADDPFSQELAEICGARDLKVFCFGESGKTLKLQKLTALPAGFQVQWVIDNKTYDLQIPLMGRFQIWNLMGALTALLAEGRAADQLMALIPQLKPVRGRIELVGQTANGAPVFVDYAHTPDALQTVLKAVREHASGALSVVFGCGGNRDKGKRPLMGKIAADLADHVIVTDDNPRFEHPNIIRQEILAACPTAMEIGDRQEAINAAVHQLQAGDILVIAGKGHEQGQIIGEHTVPFDDRHEAQQALQARLIT